MLYCIMSYIYFNIDYIRISFYRLPSMHAAPLQLERGDITYKRVNKLYENKYTEKGIHIATSIVPNLDSFEWQNEVTDSKFNQMPARLAWTLH